MTTTTRGVGMDQGRQLVRERMAAMGLSISETAHGTGIWRPALSAWLSGHRPLAAAHRRRLALELGIDPRDVGDTVSGDDQAGQLERRPTRPRRPTAGCGC